MALLAVTLSRVTGALVKVSRIEPLNRDRAFAVEAATRVSELMRSVPFDEVYARFNADPTDDPVTGSSPGAGFVARGLGLRAGDPDGMVGEILFPAIAGELREDVVDVQLGMPRDLNGDGAQDAFDHAADYDVLPVRIHLEWSGPSGDMEFDLVTTLADNAH